MERLSRIFVPVLVIALIGAAFGLGMLYQKVQYLENGVSQVAQTGAQPQAGQVPAKPTVDAAILKKAFGEGQIKFGDGNGKLTFVEGADPSCPYCHVAAGKNSELNNKMGAQFKLVADGGTYVPPVPEMRKLVEQGKASYAYLYVPGHGSGEVGQKALYCAFDQGKFWQAHDLLMTNVGYDLMNTTVKNDKTKSGLVADLLKSVVNSATLKSCMESGKYDGQLAKETQAASTLGVQGTPGFYVNTTLYAGAYSYKDMESTVLAALK